MTRALIVLLTTLCAAGASAPILAHHSFAMFDQKQCLRLTGTVKLFQFTYPHTWIWLSVEEPSQQAGLWGLQGGDPASMSAHGFNADLFKPGERITAVYNPLKDGRKGGSLQQVILPNGTVLKSVGDYEECGKPEQGKPGGTGREHDSSKAAH